MVYLYKASKLTPKIIAQWQKARNVYIRETRGISALACRAAIKKLHTVAKNLHVKKELLERSEAFEVFVLEYSILIKKQTK